MQKLFLQLGAFLGALTVLIGAFGAHGLKKILTENDKVDVFEKAVKYQAYHTFAILLIGVLLFKLQHKFFDYAGFSFLIGIIIFSGSLYILSITNIKWLGAITPIGGLAMVIGWILLAVAITKTL